VGVAEAVQQVTRVAGQSAIPFTPRKVEPPPPPALQETEAPPKEGRGALAARSDDVLPRQGHAAGTGPWAGPSGAGSPRRLPAGSTPDDDVTAGGPQGGRGAVRARRLSLHRGARESLMDVAGKLPHRGRDARRIARRGILHPLGPVPRTRLRTGHRLARGRRRPSDHGSGVAGRGGARRLIPAPNRGGERGG